MLKKKKEETQKEEQKKETALRKEEEEVIAERKNSLGKLGSTVNSKPKEVAKEIFDDEDDDVVFK
jgi:hypothetical protein